MRVLMVDPGNYTPYYDYSLCKALTRTGCEVELVTSVFLYDAIPYEGDFDVNYFFYKLFTYIASRLSFLKVSWLRKPLKALEYPVNLAFFIEYVWRKRPDILHFQWVVMPLVDYLMFKCLRELGIRLVYTAHNLLPHEEKKWHKRQYSFLYHIVDSIIVHSNSNREELIKAFAVDSGKVHVIPQGNFSDFSGRVMTKETAKRALGLDPDQRAVLFFGLIKPYKGLEYLIKAFPAVKKKVPKAVLLIVGKSEDFSPYRALIHRLGIVESVIVQPRFISYKEIATYFCAADLVVLPYIKTYQSAVLLMAYTFGRPVVTTATGGLPEVVEEGKSGYVVPPREEQELAEAICDILSDDFKMSQMGYYARYLAETRYSWQNIARATFEVYSSLVKGN